VVRVRGAGNEFLFGDSEELARGEPEGAFDSLGTREGPATVWEGGRNGGRDEMEEG